MLDFAVGGDVVARIKRFDAQNAKYLSTITPQRVSFHRVNYENNTSIVDQKGTIFFTNNTFVFY